MTEELISGSGSWAPGVLRAVPPEIAQTAGILPRCIFWAVFFGGPAFPADFEQGVFPF